MTSEVKFHSTLSKAPQCRHVAGVEELGRPFDYRAELLRLRSDGPIEADDLLGKHVSIELLDAQGQPRFYDGWVSHFERTGKDGLYDTYRVDLRPWLWYLTLSANCRIFQDKTAVQIIQEVFERYSNKELNVQLNGTYRKRAFTVQYRESDFDFVSRLMEDEGIYYYFKHSQGHHQLVLVDAASAHPPLRGGTLTWAESHTGGALDHNVVTQWSRVKSVRSLQYAHTDFDMQVPGSSLLASASRSPSHPKPAALEVFDYPGEYADLAQAGKAKVQTDEGQRLAELRIRGYESHHDVVRAVSPCRGLCAGFGFEFKGHDDAGNYLITRHEFEFRFGIDEATDDTQRWGFSGRIEAVPAKVEYLPFAVTPRPVIAGPQTATVVGPSGDVLHTDKYGRVKVQFRWDRVGGSDEDSSCWVRVSQPWASAQFGFIAVPRIGDEVIVEFLEGNPDRPLITGRVYNGEKQVPWELPAHATISGLKTRSVGDGAGTGDFHELRFEDKKDSEYIRLQSQRDFHRLVKNDDFNSVGNDRWTDVAKNDARKVGENDSHEVGKNLTLKVGADTHVTLGADLLLAIATAAGIKIGDGLDLKVASDAKLSAGSGIDIKAGAGLNATATSAVNVKGLGVVIDGQTQLTIKAGGSFITLGPEGVSISGVMVKINSGGSAGSASSAAQAAPAEPKAPEAPKENKDPLAAGGGA